MGLPRIRLRFRLRTLMILIAVLGCTFVFSIPAAQRLAWLSRTPPGTLAQFLGSIEFEPTRPPISAGGTARAACRYEVGILPSVPSWLPYHVSVQVKLTSSSLATVYDQRETGFWLVSGTKSAEAHRGQFSCDLKPPGPGSYTVRYEVYMTDLFGRRAMTACHTGGLDVGSPGR